ncbi:MAG: hypothetical protein QF464_00705 [Myxococcota bacterium]|nr:hypothetical protein [Myxococcota bacterium]
MQTRTILTAFVLSSALLMSSLPPAAADAGRITGSELETAVLHVFNTGRALEQIDRAFNSGALTWSEAQALYAEQGVIRSAYIRGKGLHGPEFAARRAAFMLRVSQSTYAQLAFNSEQRRPVQRQVSWAW